ncbi:hypothetical protein CDCA_CDCA20G4778 [Cyanidium caldarium]|uniref:Uncharacterized protein n=1 Tax=Cyanidium caldarium TaxID=2771 RepID=A0AAV9J2D7_CYACA|nr:hypothetical protein CDCA_CDCA20G4778 [Cyanidium caldarium]
MANGERDERAHEPVTGSDVPRKSQSRNALGLPRTLPGEGWGGVGERRTPFSPNGRGDALSSGSERSPSGSRSPKDGRSSLEGVLHALADKAHISRENSESSEDGRRAGHATGGAMRRREVPPLRLQRATGGGTEGPHWSSSSCISRSATEDPTLAAAQMPFLNTPRLGSFDGGAGGVLRSQDSWRPTIPQDEVFCAVDGQQVAKLEKVVEALRALAPDDDETCTIPGTELRAMLEHRGVHADIDTVQRLLHEASTIDIDC